VTGYKNSVRNGATIQESISGEKAYIVLTDKAFERDLCHLRYLNSGVPLVKGTRNKKGSNKLGARMRFMPSGYIQADLDVFYDNEGVFF
jgi:hypothetical protein